MKKYILVLAFSLISFSEIIAQVTIAPTNLFITDRTKFGTYMVINGSNTAQEISIDFLFAYSQSDENGDRKIINDDSLTAEQYSMADWVRAFPKNFTINPGQRQIVRLRVNAPNDIPDGMYWARIKTASSPVTPPVELQSTEAVTARVGIRIEQVTGAFYKKGTVSTGIEIEDISTNLSTEDSKVLSVLTKLKRTGNAPFLGSITTSLINSKGEEVRRGFVSTSIYFDGVHREDFEIGDLPAGTYSISTKFETSRNDIASSDLIQMPMVSKSITYNLR